MSVRIPILDALRPKTDTAPYDRADAQLVSTDVSATIPNPKPPRPLKGWQERALEREQAAVDAGRLLSNMNAHLGGILAAIKAPPMGDVLGHVMLEVPASGVAELRWPDTFQAITLTNLSLNSLTAHAAPPQGFVPTVGSGLMAVLPSIQRTQPLRGTVLSIYGAAGSLCEVTAYSRPRDPAAGPCGGDAVDPAVLTVAQPAAGADWTSPAISPGAPFTIDAVIATVAAGTAEIYPDLRFYDPAGDLVAHAITTSGISAGDVAMEISWWVGSAQMGGIGGQWISFPMPRLWLPAGSSVGVASFGLSATTQWSSIRVTWRTASAS